MKSPARLSDLTPNAANPRTISGERLELLRKSLNEFGDLSGYVFNAKTGLLVGGHQREKVMPADSEIVVTHEHKKPTRNGTVRQGYVLCNGERFAYREVAWPKKKERAAMLAANQHGGDWATDQLEELLRDMDESERLLAGFDLDGLKEIGIELNGEQEMHDAAPQIDHAKALQKKWKTKRGQVWRIGEHQLFCADFRDNQVCSAIKQVEMIFSDPPFGHNNNDGDLIHRRESALGVPKTKSSAPRPIQNDSPEEAAAVFKAFCEMSSILLPGGCCCCCCCGGGGGPDPQFARWSLELDKHLPFKHAVVWDKGGLGMGWHYRRNYEFVLIAQKPGAACRWFGGNDVPNVIRDIGKIIPQADQHPTEKPVELPAWFIKLHSQKADTVFDPFLGSGTTMVACQNLGRKCVGAEIAPEYVAVALQRMDDAFGIVGEVQ